MKSYLNTSGAKAYHNEQSLEQYQNHVEEELKKRCLPYTSPTSEKIPIIAHSPIPGDVTVTQPLEGSNEPDDSITPDDLDTVFMQIKECGFNTVLWGGGKEWNSPLKRFLTEIEQFDLAVILEPQWLDRLDEDGKIDDQPWEKGYTEFSKYSSVKGWDIRDEPNYSRLFSADSQDFRMYSHFVEKEKSGSRRPVYFNLAPRVDSDYIGDLTGCYKGFLQLIEMKYLPSLWSYDFYPFSVKNCGDEKWKTKWLEVPSGDAGDASGTYPCSGNVDVLYEGFFYYLSAFARRSVRTGRPFWAYCMCVAHKIGEHLLTPDSGQCVIRRYLPAPTAGMLRFEAFGALAFGAQGIVYWSYGDWDDGEGMIFKDAPLRNDLSLSPVWYNCRTVNREIAAFNDVFLDCQFVKAAIVGDGFFANGFDGVPNIGALALDADEPMSKSVITPMKSGTGFLVTHIVKNGLPWLVCLNLNPFESRNISIRMRPKDGYLLRQFSKQADTTTDMIVDLWRSSGYETRTFTLSPGGIIAVRIG